MSIPLVQNNEKDSINTSIIAIKRNIERINMLLGLSNSEEIDTSEFVKKSDIVDEVTVGNMQSVTSNAVAVAMSYSETEHFTGKYWKNGKKIYEKVINCGNLPNSTSKSVAHGVVGLERLVTVSTIAKSVSDNTTYFLPVPYGSSADPVMIYVSTSHIILSTITNLSSWGETEVTLEYTKTTD